MKIRKKKSESEIDQEVKAVLIRMKTMDPLDEEYRKMCDVLSELLGLKRAMNHKNSISPDTVAIIAANLLGLLIVLGYEQGHVITSKAFSMISKLKL